MIPVLLCKINEYHASFISFLSEIAELSLEKDTSMMQLRKKYAEIWPIAAEHIACRKKAARKLPTWLEASCIFTSKTYEQSTSELVANFKSNLFPPGNLLSITGGLGVDDVSFHHSGFKVTSIDSNPCINALFGFNMRQLKVESVTRITSDAESYLASNKQIWDFIYADPDRRAENKRETSNAKAYQPDIFHLFHQYRSLANTWIIKLSPMTDLKWIRAQFPHKADIYVISVSNEIKELLVVISKSALDKNFLCSLTTGGNPFVWDGSPVEFTADHNQYFYEASAAALKTEFNRNLPTLFGLSPLNRNHTYFEGQVSLPEGICRRFLLMHKLEGSLTKIAQALHSMGIDRANVNTREFTNSTDETREILKLKDGGENYLFFTGKGKQKQCFVTAKV